MIAVSWVEAAQYVLLVSFAIALYKNSVLKEEISVKSHKKYVYWVGHC